MRRIFACISSADEFRIRDCLSRLGNNSSSGEGAVNEDWQDLAPGALLENEDLGLVYYADCKFDFLPHITPEGPRPILYRPAPGDNGASKPPSFAAREPTVTQFSSLPSVFPWGRTTISVPQSLTPTLFGGAQAPTLFGGSLEPSSASGMSTPTQSDAPILTPSTFRATSPGPSNIQASRRRPSAGRVLATRTRALVVCVDSSDADIPEVSTQRPKTIPFLGANAGWTLNNNPASGAGIAPDAAAELRELVSALPTGSGRQGPGAQVRSLRERRRDEWALLHNVQRSARRVAARTPGGDKTRVSLFCRRLLAELDRAEQAPGFREAAKQPRTEEPTVFDRYAVAVSASIGHFESMLQDAKDGFLSNTPQARGKVRAEADLVADLFFAKLGGSSVRVRAKPADAKEMAQALTKVVEWLMLQQRWRFGNEAEANSVNIIVTNGQELVAMRFRNHALEDPPPLFYTVIDGKDEELDVQMSVLDGLTTDSSSRRGGSGKQVLVSSDVMPEETLVQWPMEKNTMLLVDSMGSVQMQPVDYPLGMNSTMQAMEDDLDSVKLKWHDDLPFRPGSSQDRRQQEASQY